MSDVMDNQLTILKRDARGRLRSTAEARAEAVAEYRRSGLSASAFATMVGISKNTFWNWLHNHGLTQKRALSKAKSHPPVRFVQVVTQAAPASALLVGLPGGATVEVADDQDRTPILPRFGPAFSPECSAFPFLALAISASIIACVTAHRSGFGSVLPA